MVRRSTATTVALAAADTGKGDWEADAKVEELRLQAAAVAEVRAAAVTGAADRAALAFFALTLESAVL